MIRAVFDANVIAAGIPATSGTLSALIDRWRSDRFTLVLSDYLIDELLIAWSKPYWRRRLSDAQVDLAIHLLRRQAEVIPISVDVQGVASHHHDDQILATVASANADVLVTGDLDLRALHSFARSAIVSPAEFLAILDERPPHTP